MSEAFIGLGSNLSDPVSQIKRALAAMACLPRVEGIRASSLYRSAPWGVWDQPDFVNAVAWVRTRLSPWELWDHLQHIEKEQNRVKVRRWGERTIDCDILLFDQLRLNSDQLTIPHVYLEEREFVLVPLAELSANLILPSGRCVAERVRTMDLCGLTKLQEVCL